MACALWMCFILSAICIIYGFYNGKSTNPLFVEDPLSNWQGAGF